MVIKDKKCYCDKKHLRLLITDPYTPQSYDIVRALHHLCEKIVVAVPNIGRFPQFFLFTAHSRLISKAYRIKSAKPPDTLPIMLDKGYTVTVGKEYIDELMYICEQERINCIYPSSDDEVFLLAKHKRIFEERGVIIPVNEYEVLKSIADKFNIIQLARQKEIPCPETFLATDINSPSFKETCRNNPMAIIKPRFGCAARGILFINKQDDLERWIKNNKHNAHEFVVQEYIPGDTIVNVRVYMKQDGTALHVSCSSCQRPQMIIHQSAGIIHSVEKNPVYCEKIISLLRDKKYVGYGHAQFKIDARNGEHKLMEINVRLGRGTWTEVRQGINRPLISLALFKNKEIEIPKSNDKTDMVFAYPVQDVFIFILYLFSKLGKIIKGRILCSEKTKRLPPIKEMLKHYHDIYFSGKRKVEYDNYVKFFLKDPLVSLNHWFLFCYQLRRRFKEWNF
ncbi:MAG: ATP-grasp domain-containing protein [Candidatus Omnitrophica bacterium]|nr:ATP-grasp domain-containing protein [Candidatus Omnitrophota bacterium]MBU1925756.1 ATP-grasp domain-containing protein [Candidatus Omnitrophota bacterium]